MNRKSFFVGILAAGCFIVSLMRVPNAASAQADDPKVAKAMELLKANQARSSLLWRGHSGHAVRHWL